MKIAVLLLLSGMAYAQTTVSGAGMASGSATAGDSLVDPTPPMGWSSWPLECGVSYPCPSPTQITETAAKAQTDNLDNTTLPGLCAVEYPNIGSPCKSLMQLGYTVVGIFETWDSRDASGNLQCIPANFPDGCSGMGTYIHTAGGKFGLYGAPGTTTCAGYPAQFPHVYEDATIVASWGVDYWYYDWCTDAPTVWGSSSAGAQAAYQAMGTGLQRTGRRISYLVNYAASFSPSWFKAVGATSVRVGEDNLGGWWYTKATGDLSFAAPYQSRGHWIDFDILMGNLYEGGAHGTATAVSDAEARAQFNWLAITAAPLFIGSQIQLLDSTNLQTYANSEVIAVDQDSLGQMGTLADSTTCGATVCQVWTRLLANGCYAAAYINYDPSNTHSVALLWSDFGQSGTFQIRDLWAHASEGSSSTGYTVSLGAWGSTMVTLCR